MSLPAAARQALDAFTGASGWEARTRLLMKAGDDVPAFPAHLRDDAHLVAGCESRVWLDVRRDGERLRILATSEARLLRGLLALLLARLDGLTITEIDAVDLPAWFTALGLARQLSPSRSNGLNAVWARIREKAGEAS